MVLRQADGTTEYLTLEINRTKLTITRRVMSSCVGHCIAHLE
jgi:hypothetical protein